jgi:hypothetical protein
MFVVLTVFVDCQRLHERLPVDANHSGGKEFRMLFPAQLKYRKTVAGEGHHYEGHPTTTYGIVTIEQQIGKTVVVQIRLLISFCAKAIRPMTVGKATIIRVAKVKTMNKGEDRLIAGQTINVVSG